MLKLAFTLVELSIVLIIIGLLIGAILAGRGLIEQAKLRATASQHRNFNTAVRTFKLMYHALPGDFGSATRYLPSAVGDGNADGYIDEDNLAWNHLSLADMLEGTYDGTPYETHQGATGQSGNPTTEFGNGLFWSFGNPLGKAASHPFGASQYGDINIKSGEAGLALGAFGYFGKTPTIVGGLSHMRNHAIDIKYDDGVADTGYVRGAYTIGKTELGCTGDAYDLSGASPDDCLLSWKLP